MPAQTWMKRIIFLLLLCPLGVHGQPKSVVEKSSPQLVYLLSFEETTRLLNDEFERTNSEAVKTRRKEAVRMFADSVRSRPMSAKRKAKSKPSTKSPNPSPAVSNSIPNDTYAVAASENIVQWMNETLRKVCEGMPDKNYMVVDSKTLPNYDAENYRYVLQYTYVFDNGDPMKAKMVFYYYDRVEHKAMMDNRALAGRNTYYPFFYYKGEKSYPFYGMIRSSRVRKEWTNFFRSL
jgi:hypothetical protein